MREAITLPSEGSLFSATSQLAIGHTATSRLIEKAPILTVPILAGLTKRAMGAAIEKFPEPEVTEKLAFTRQSFLDAVKMWTKYANGELGDTLPVNAFNPIHLTNANYDDVRFDEALQFMLQDTDAAVFENDYGRTHMFRLATQDTEINLVALMSRTLRTPAVGQQYAPARRMGIDYRLDVAGFDA